MKQFATIWTAWLLVASSAMPGADTTAQAEKLLEGARHKEVMEGDLKAAIEQYRKIAAQFSKQPEIAARALFQLGQCQEKLGQTEARKSYERIVREYGGAQQYASAARARLAAIGGAGSAGRLAMRAIWTGNKVDEESSLSPDGRFITFPDWDTYNLAVHDLVTGADSPLTTTGSSKRGETAFAESSAISRDGKQVAYTWSDDKLQGRYELRVASISGDPKPRRVLEMKTLGYLEPCDWSPDGKWIAVSMWSPAVSSPNRTQQIGLIAAQDGSLRLLKSGTDHLLIGGFSPDGKYVVYTRRIPDGASAAYILSADGKLEVPLLSGPSSVDAPAWTPDGSRIVFVSDRSGSPGLWSVRVVDGKPLGEPELLKADFTYARTESMSTPAMGFARDGSLIYRVKVNQKDVYLAGLDPATGKLASEPKRINKRGIGNSDGLVAWLPDGKSLSFWNRGRIGALVVHTLATGEEREIWGGKSGHPAAGYFGWFPDGRSLMSVQGTSQTRLYSRVDSRTGDVQASWTPDLPAESRVVAFSPDLMTVYFSQKDRTSPCEGTKCTQVIFARDLKTGRDREIFRIRVHNGINASISHDGREMAFTIWDENAIMVVPTAGGSPREIYRALDDKFKFHTRSVWMPDGQHVLAFRFMPSGGELWSFPTKGGSPEKSPLRIRPVAEPAAVSPDGTQIAFTGGGGKSEVWVMTGLFQDAQSVAAR